MARDFLASQIRTNQIIGTKSGSLPTILIISSSISNGLGGISGPSLGAGSEVFFFVSGSRADNALTLFGGKVKISGSLFSNDGFINNGNTRLGNSAADLHNVTGTLEVLNDSRFIRGISGSIQQTAAGLSYLVAGSNVTISTASNGQITIAATAGGGSSQWTGAAEIYTTSSVAIGVANFASTRGSDISFFVSGSTTAGSGQAVFGGSVFISGSTTVNNNANVNGNSVIGTTSANTIEFKSYVSSSIVPSADMTYDLGSASFRWRNMYTGDLHLKNSRGDWTIIEEEEFLSITNNRTGKRYKFVMEEI